MFKSMIDQRTSGLTWVGARVTCVSKKLPQYNETRSKFPIWRAHNGVSHCNSKRVLQLPPRSSVCHHFEDGYIVLETHYGLQRGSMANPIIVALCIGNAALLPTWRFFKYASNLGTFPYWWMRGRRHMGYQRHKGQASGWKSRTGEPQDF